MNYCSKTSTQGPAGTRSSASPRIIVAALLGLMGALLSGAVLGDAASAAQAMESSRNPLLHLDTSRGDIFVELFPAEAPANVANILALASGEKEIEDPDSGFVFQPNYYDGLRFHRVVPGFVIQTGAPVNHPLGAPGEELSDEINADSLGLDREPVMLPGGEINPLLDINSREEFESNVLAHLLSELNIDSEEALRARQDRIFERLQTLTIKQLYELQGYRYRTDITTRPILRGTVVLANSGPDSNGPEFFIALSDSPTLDGRYTVIGRVAEGMDAVDAIASTEVDPQRFSRLSTVIYTARQVNAANGSLAAR